MREFIPSVPTGGAEAPRGPERNPGPYVRFLCLTLLFVVLGFVAAFPLVRSSLYPKWRDRQWGPMLDFAFRPGGEDADIVIFGDSSAFIGIDPRILNAQLGLKTILLPNTIGSLPITGEIPLDRYLQHHARPRLLVLYFSPWNLDYTRAKEVFLFEGEEMIFRNGTWEECAAFAVRHPFETMVFPFRLYNTYAAGIFRTLRHPSSPAPTLAGASGHMDDTDPFPKLQASCKIPEAFLKQRGVSSIEALAAKYSGTVPVMLYLAPVPGCHGATAVTHWSFPLHAAAPEVLAPGEVVGDRWFAHVKPAFVPVSSHLLAQAIGQRLGVPVQPSSMPSESTQGSQ